MNLVWATMSVGPTFGRGFVGWGEVTDETGVVGNIEGSLGPEPTEDRVAEGGLDWCLVTGRPTGWKGIKKRYFPPSSSTGPP